MEELDIDQHTEKEAPRPSFLTVLCILSYVFIGFSLLFGLIGLVKGPESEEEMLNAKVELFKAVDDMRSMNMDGMADMFEKIQRMSESMNANFYGVAAVSISVLLIGLFGVLRMWKGHRMGFHIYIVYSLLSVVQLYLFVSSKDIPTFVIIWNLIISGLFIFMYSRNLKWMTK